ncbi:lipopolysaccharide biosynthesis protein [Aeromonas dhakensis]|uniref:lipopolysaccharide biosynthesis protein n=1 Tax=Aeromonas dhakensis TaxID=196024 RepID=UPI00370D1375
MSGFNRLLKNSLANIINGFSNVILGIVISPFLLQRLPIDSFSIWNLSIQVGAFFALIGFGCQLTVARNITIAREKKDSIMERHIIKNGIILSSLGIILSCLLLTLIYNNFYSIFSKVEGIEASEDKVTFFVVAISFVIGLISSVFSGFFTGIERNDIPAMINLLSRVILGILIVMSAQYGIKVMSYVYLVVNVLSYLTIYISYSFFRNPLEDKPSKDGFEYKFGKFFSYFIGISVFNLASFMLVGLNGILVGKYAFDEFAYYSLGMSLVTAAVGFINAAMSPIIQPLVKLSNRSDSSENLNKLLYNLTLIVMLLSIISIIIAFYVGPFILSLWVGDSISTHVENIFVSLMAVNLVRLVGAPLGLLYIAQAKQNKIMHYPLMESVISVVLTIILIHSYGMYAVPIGLAISAFLILFIYSFKLLNILDDHSYFIRYKLIFLIYPLSMFVFVVGLVEARKENIDIVSYMLNFLSTLALTIGGYLVLRKTKNIKKILEV